MGIEIIMKTFWIFSLCLFAISRVHSDEDVVTVETINPSDDIIYLTPKQDPDVFFADHFDNQADFTKKWIKSQAKKEGVIDESIAKYDGEWSLEQSQKDPLNGDLGLVLKTKAKHAAIAAPLGKIYKFEDKPFVVQYELNFQKLGARIPRAPQFHHPCEMMIAHFFARMSASQSIGFVLG